MSEFKNKAQAIAAIKARGRADMGEVLRQSVTDIIRQRHRQFRVEATGAIFVGITETDLAHELRDRRWRLPRSWLSEVEALGFSLHRPYKDGDIRTHFDEPAKLDPDTGRPFKYDSFQRRLLGQYITIIRAQEF